jgi:hypothetical protein
MRPTPKEFFTMDYLRRRRDDRPPPVLFHWTRTVETARGILSVGAILGHPTVHLTENPALIEAGSIGWLVDTAAILRLGFHLYPTQSQNWPHEAEWTVGAANSERMGSGGEADSAIWSSRVRLPLDAVARKMLVREHALRRHPDLLREFERTYPWGPVVMFEWDDWWEHEPLPVALNPLLAKPPRRVHQLRNTRWFRMMVGRLPRESDYDGVHTATDPLIAAAYAMGSLAAGDVDSNGYPVLVTLDVSGLEALPDVDALVRGGEAADVARSEYRKRVADGETMDDILDEDEEFGAEPQAREGDEPAAFIFEDVGSRPLHAIRDYADDSGDDAEEIFERFLATGELPNGVLTRLVGQQRYLNDFDLDRVVRIEAIRPWWRRVISSYDDPRFEKLQERGYQVFTMDELPIHSPGDRVTLYEAPPQERTNVEYHGTTSVVIDLAFPGLIPEETLFPVTEEDDDEDE